MEDSSPFEQTPASKGPDLLSTPAIDREIEAWQRTGVFPFPELGLRSSRQFYGLSTIDLRLIHHLCSIYKDMQVTGLARCTLWVQDFPRCVYEV